MRGLVWAAVCSGLFCGGVFGADVQGARIVRGDWRQVDAAAFGFSPDAKADVNAKALQTALDGGRRVVTVTAPGTYDIDRICLIDSDTELAFGAGTRLRKARPMCVALANRAAYCGGVDSNIVVRGLSFVVNGHEPAADPNGPAPGLQGHVSFFHVNDLEIRDFSCTDFVAAQYCLQVVDFRGFTIDGFDIRGEKDGIHLNAGRDFVVRNGTLRTGDDGIAINAGEWPDFTPRMGSICDGLIENVHDLPGGRCNFARVITGAWVQWHPGIRLQRNDLCNVGNNVYGVTPMPLGTNEYVSLTAPSHTHGVWKSPEGISFLFLQSNGVSRVDISNVTFRNVKMDCARTVSCSWETYEWARLIHPELPRKDYPAIDIRLENVVKSVRGAVVSGNADANVAFADCRTADGPLLEMWWSRDRTFAPRRRVTVDGVTHVSTNGAVRVEAPPRSPRKGIRPNAVFGVLSDIHLRTWEKESGDFLRTALRRLSARGVDGVVVSGDLTDGGTVDELRLFGRIWNEAFPGNRRADGGAVEKLFVYGDHDVENFHNPAILRWWRQNRSLEALEKVDIVRNDWAKQWRLAFGEDFAPIRRKRVKGYDFVLASLVNREEEGLRRGDPLYIPGLEEFFATNAFDRTRPFFYVQHKILKGTAGGPKITGQDSGRTTAILNRWPNAVAFCGHKHKSATDERSLWQGAFTAVEVPSVYRLQTHAGRENGWSSCERAEHMPPCQMPVMQTRDDGAQGLVVSVYDDGFVIERLDLLHGAEAAPPWNVPFNRAACHPASFESRARAGGVPQFPVGARVTVVEKKGKDRTGKATDQLEVRFPTAVSLGNAPRAHDYEVRAVLTKAYVTRIVGAKRVYPPKCYLPEAYDRLGTTCVFAKDEIPSDHDFVVFEVSPLNAFGSPGGMIRSAPVTFTHTPVIGAF